MYCNKCGTRLYGDESFCTGCGNKIGDEIKSINNKEIKDGKKTASIVLGILSLVGSLLFIFAPLSFILAVIGLILGIVATKKVKNVSGIVLNSIGIFLSLIMSIFIILVFLYAFNSVGDTIEDLWDIEENYEYDYKYDDMLSDF